MNSSVSKGTLDATSDIAIRQDQPREFSYMEARQWRWRVAVKWQVAQLSIVVALPALLAIIGFISPTLKPVISFVAVAITLCDIIFIDRQYRKAIKTAARMSEVLDVDLFQIPWNKLAAGPKPDAEDVKRAARCGSRMATRDDWKGWYASVVDNVPLPLARLICQRTNLVYDSDLRGIYIILLSVIGSGICLIVFLAGMVSSATFGEFVLTSWVPASPLAIWALREGWRQRDAVEANAPVKAEAERLLHLAIAGDRTDAQLEADSRLMQNSIFVRRSTTPLLFPGIYKLRRRKSEDAMHDGAAYWVDLAH
jgi:hypothetical protein